MGIFLRNISARVVSFAGHDVLPLRDVEVSEATFAALEKKVGISQLLERTDRAEAREALSTKRAEGLGGAPAPVAPAPQTKEALPDLLRMSEADAIKTINLETDEATLRSYQALTLPERLKVAVSARLAKILPAPPKT